MPSATNSETPVIEVNHVATKFGQAVVHEDVSLSIRRGEIFAIAGGNGSGKTTLLREIIGLITPSSGMIRLFGIDSRRLEAGDGHPIHRRFGVMFQHGALFSSFTLAENVAVPLREHTTLSTGLIRDIVVAKIAMVGLPPDSADKYPNELSGGMQRRAALARAIVMDPELLFLDEPTAGLDPEASDEFVELISALHRALGLTVVMVTHDLDTMVALSTRVAVLADRKVLVAAPVEEAAGVDHLFIREYFLGLRGRRALQALPPERRAKLPLAALEPASSELPL